MANASFTRDEVILALDVLFTVNGRTLSAKSAEMLELSELLNELPIHQIETRKEYFRTPSGIFKQISYFKRSWEKGIKDKDVGFRFYEVAIEFKDRHKELHEIATAIKNNIESYKIVPFGSPLEEGEFPEGALLGHLHCIVEKRDSRNIIPNKRCEICRIEPGIIYSGSPDIMTMHLAVPITKIDGHRRYSSEDFITVCPNCHAALHSKRPWLTKKECGLLIE